MVAVGIVLTGAAFVVALTAPDAYTQQGTFVTSAREGELASGRSFDAIFGDVRTARLLAAPGWVGETAGVWIVVEAEVAATTESATPAAWLTIGERTFAATDRTDVTLESRVDAGLPVAGVFAFEVPASALDDPDADSATLRMSNVPTPRLDSVLSYTFDVQAVPLEQTISIDEPKRVVW